MSVAKATDGGHLLAFCTASWMSSSTYSEIVRGLAEGPAEWCFRNPLGFLFGEALDLRPPRGRVGKRLAGLRAEHVDEVGNLPDHVVDAFVEDGLLKALVGVRRDTAPETDDGRDRIDVAAEDPAHHCVELCSG